MEFANNDTKVGLVLSDMYVGGKMLARVQAERRFVAIQTLQQASNMSSILKVQDAKRRQSIRTLQANEEGTGCVVAEKSLLTSSNSDDVEVLRNLNIYSIYAQYVRSFLLICLLLCLSKCFLLRLLLCLADLLSCPYGA